MQYAADTSDFRPLYDLLQQITGITINESQRAEAANVARQIIAQVGYASLPNLLKDLATTPVDQPLWQDLIRVITVGETYFFRDKAQFSALRNHILPALIAERRRMSIKHLRIWSAGCAGGEEAYSLAILLHELLPDIQAWTLTLLGTDINLDALQRAQQGVYRQWSFRTETPEDLKGRWFSSTVNGFEIDKRLRRMVIFKPLNLVSDIYPSYETDTMNMDLIVCRNVTIYFEQPTVRAIIERFYKALVPNGWLNVGYSEPMASLYDQYFAARNFEHAILYQRVEPVVENVPLTPNNTSTNGTRPLRTTGMLPKTALLGSSQAKTQTFGATPNAKTRSLQPPAPAESVPPLANPSDISELLTRAQKSADREKWAEVEQWIVKAETLDRLHPYIHYLYGLIHLQSGRTDEAIEALRRSVYCDISFSLAHLALADLYIKRNDSKLALYHLHLTQKAISGLSDSEEVPFATELTAEMMREIIKFQVKMVHKSNGERSNVNL